MCSYGGNIVPNPRTKSLRYSGGDTRILSVDTAVAATLSSLTTHLANALSLQDTPFFLKYQPPHHDFMSLVSLSTDDDLHVFLDELRRLTNSALRIRLFVFSPKSHYQSKVIRHPKTESWFVDALESAKIVMQKTSNGLVGYDGEIQSLSGEFWSGGSAAAESIVLETSSSFGSATSSWASVSNSPSVKVREEDAVAATLLDNKVRVAAVDSIARGSECVGFGNGISHSETGFYEETVINAASRESRISSNHESDIKLGDPNFSRPQVQLTVQACGYYLMPPRLDQLQQPRPQFVQVGTHYIAQNPVGLVPFSPYYPMYHPQLHQHQPLYLPYQPNQPYPLYILPVAPTQPCNFPMHGSLIETTTIAHGQPPLHPNTSCIPPQATHKELIDSGASPDFSSQIYRPVHSEMPQHVEVVHVPYDETQQQSLGVSDMQNEPIAVSTKSPTFRTQPDNDHLRPDIQI